MADHAYDPRGNKYIPVRITGNFTGTADGIFQWAAAKWGIRDNWHDGGIGTPQSGENCNVHGTGTWSGPGSAEGSELRQPEPPASHLRAPAPGHAPGLESAGCRESPSGMRSG